MSREEANNVVMSSTKHRTILFCGLGSIGQKHLRNLVAILNKRQETFTIDAIRSSSRPLPEDIASLISHTYTSYADVSSYDIVMVTNPTYLHYETIVQLQGKAKAMFVEKPVFDSIKELRGIDTSVVFYVACPLRHTSIYRHVRETIDLNKVFHVRALCSSYLPDWRPNTDYTSVYSAKKEMGGGVELDLIHEWDYLGSLFGIPEEVIRISRKNSDLQISSNDVALYIGQQPNRLIELHLDYFGRLPRRELELYTPDNTYLADINNSTITDAYHPLQSIDKEDMYLNEMNYFLNLVDGETKNINDIWYAQQMLGIAIK